MTEQKLMGIVADLFPKGMDSDYQSGLVAGFHDITPSPCPTKNVRCAEGVVAGKLLHEFFFGLSGETDDDLVAISVAGLLCLDSKTGGSRIVSYASHQKGHLLNERRREGHSPNESTSPFSSFSDVLRIAEETGSGGYARS
jgi:hypothetical protein